MKLLDVNNLSTYFFTDEGTVPAVQEVSYHIDKGETLGLVGESGCGKSVTALSIMRLIESPPGKIVNGSINFNGNDLTKFNQEQMQEIRGNDIGMIFQEPMTSLNPVYTVGFQIVEAIVQHQDVDDDEAHQKAVEALKHVGIPSPERRFFEYPHQMSGGMRQRVMIAMSLACKPDLLIADEPTTALDVTIQAQILDLMKKLQEESGMSILLITHDLAVVAETCHRVIVMYAGNVVESANVIDLFKNPNHPYTNGLLQSIPKLNEDKKFLYDIKGVVPDPRHFPTGCKFHPRCPQCFDKCKKEQPPLKLVGDNHKSACWLNDK